MVETPQTALVVEGGGMRGAYAAGALVDLLQDQGLAFDGLWATSSGAASAAYALAGQDEGIDIWRDHLHGRRLVHPLRFLRGREALDLDYLIDEVFRRRIPLDTVALGHAATPLRVPVTDVADGEVRYFDLRRSDPFAVLRAAMSLPGAVLRPVDIDGHQYVDGGVVDQVPLLQAMAAGATRITVVLTRPADHRAAPTGRWGMWLATRRFPGIRAALDQRHRRYEAAMRLLAHPPHGVTFRIVRPSRNLPLRRWTTHRQRLLEAIDQGARDAREATAAATP